MNEIPWVIFAAKLLIYCYYATVDYLVTFLVRTSKSRLKQCFLTLGLIWAFLLIFLSSRKWQVFFHAQESGKFFSMHA